MNAVTGGLVGALVAGLAVFGWRSRPGAMPEASFFAAASAVHPISDSEVFGPSAPRAFGATPLVSVRCEPGQRAVLRQVGAASGQAATETGCVTDSVAVVQYGSPHTAGVIDPDLVRPARYVTSERVVPERVVYRERSVRRAAPARSWQKRALVIGGAAGAGAGIGALAGGKKGALIGAAVGGGAGTVYELPRK
jgi:hypothetical protein